MHAPGERKTGALDASGTHHPESGASQSTYPARGESATRTRGTREAEAEEDLDPAGPLRPGRVARPGSLLRGLSITGDGNPCPFLFPHIHRHVRSYFVNGCQHRPSHDSVGRITVSLLLPPGVSIPPASAKNDITVELPTGADFYNCEECVNVPPVDYIYGVTSFVMEKLIFTKYSIPGFFSGSARVSLELTPSNVAMNFDGINAYAAIPEVTLTGQARGALLLAAFHIPSASSYDWSSSPPENVESSEVDWNEFLKTGDTAGRTTVGINHARMANDATLNFLAGALIGLAAAAILSAVQEALHVFTDTSTTTRPAPNDE